MFIRSLLREISDPYHDAAPPRSASADAAYRRLRAGDFAVAADMGRAAATADPRWQAFADALAKLKDHPSLQLRALRELADLTVGELAKRLGVSESAIWRRERGAHPVRAEHVAALRYVLIEREIEQERA